MVLVDVDACCAVSVPQNDNIESGVSCSKKAFVKFVAPSLTAVVC